ncbi:hypothetical protein HETIRDRAFT_162901 [Heterobasidion irregulare TC 32-1]|uniref:Uncharacterized protein n=1 Tax=Heterobasidion irregulare (strain TC 32-1) TaxID=747525 RepID=W4JRQ6_HETIT|nr:uncharacterized protein HETIRDRAFT_162901 [Heterobasidion irregulare TC 32-1]ETW76149.1 hypothetical protein HETIRDRAFT_162901 [Heterobasidion irregulare TC 32-1]
MLSCRAEPQQPMKVNRDGGHIQWAWRVTCRSASNRCSTHWCPGVPLITRLLEWKH